MICALVVVVEVGRGGEGEVGRLSDVDTLLFCKGLAESLVLEAPVIDWWHRMREIWELRKTFKLVSFSSSKESTAGCKKGLPQGSLGSS